MFAGGDRVAIAVSGGADSVCLLHVLRELGPRWDLTLSVVHINHNLRGDASRGDAEFVRSLAASFDHAAILEKYPTIPDDGKRNPEVELFDTNAKRLPWILSIA